MKTILITGGTGLIGKQLTKLLNEKGYRVHWLTRKKDPLESTPQFLWDWKNKKIDIEALIGVEAIINLAGANINGKRWSNKWKKEIYDSRIRSTEFLFEILSKEKHQIKTFICASATGYYGAVTTEHVFIESDLPGTDFLAETTKDWEAVAEQLNSLNIRTVKVRTGIVLSIKGGAFSKMLLPFKYGIATVLGSGKQYFPWIHIEDICQIYFKAITDDKMTEAYNAVAPVFTTNIEFTRALASKLKQNNWLFHLPSFFLKVILGELSEAIINGSRISADKILSTGYHFKFSNLENTLKDLTDKQK